MTIHDFNHLSAEVQLANVFQRGTYLARRWDDFHQAVNLYRMPSGFFVEVNYDTEKNEIEFLFAFEAGGEDDRLPDYAIFVELPEWGPYTE
ncbi:hypothetical protein GCM10028824_36760 [Hymenobacter segetis]|uniref:Uncharacterized protein n=1 Tax=Hymenobacter segetis TaxID=2025509 RepID=A0ABU9LVL1_9BACT